MIRCRDWSSVDWETVREGVERKAFSGDGATMALHRLWPGHEPRPHSHPYEQLVYIMAGKVAFHVGDEMIVLEEGGLLVVPPNVLHHAEVIGNEPVLNLDVFVPRRADYD